MKKVIVGSDDLYPCARFAVEYLKERGYEVEVVGSLKTGRPEPWPDVAHAVALAVARGEADWGIVVCYTGTGVSIVANKVYGVRAALCPDAQTARGARLWNNANVLAMSGRLTTEVVTREILEAWTSVENPNSSELQNIEKLEEIDRTHRRR
ncbi:MAG: RpiB/LacA/LacB family sugar-phosphate isomerase [Sulfolobales archaeon]|nr:RpiB/LacA/LacB family sugar-phosphate isomerase [Sulfolobales archaeon]MDW8083492.1 RpiB/LacA/LacB family sugar-phosphate isomerase [Sulfolobales archaeon]